MYSLIKQVFIVLSSFSNSLARVAKFSNRTKCLSLSDESCMVRPSLLPRSRPDLNPVELSIYD